MKFVEIYRFKKADSPKMLAVCKLIDGNVVCEGDETFIKNLETDGIFDYSEKSQKKLFFKDGLRFLCQLKYNFKSGYLLASEIKEN